MKLLITGANGLLGQKLIYLLDDEPGIRTFATSKGESRIFKLGNFSYHPAELTDQQQVGDLFDRVKPDVVIHTAAITQPDACELEPKMAWQVNVGAVQTLAEQVKKHNSLLVHLSTDFVFDGEKGMYDETAVPAPVNYYGQTKYEAEKVVQQADVNHAIVRTVLVYGINPAMSRSNIILWVKNNLEQGKPIRVVNDQWRTPTLAEDLATGCLLIAKHYAGKQAREIFHIAGSELMTPYEMALQAADFFGLDASLISPTNAAEFKEVARRPLRTGCVIEKAQRLLGYQPHSFRQGLEVLKGQI